MPGATRHVHLVLENDRNEARRLARDRAGRPRSATAQWNDDVHHALHVLVTGERDGYYADYAARPLWRSAAASPRGLPIRASRRRFAAARRAASRARACRRAPSSSSCRSTTRSATARSASGSSTLAERARAARRRRLRAAGALAADAVHGRGIRRHDALPVLLRFRAASWPRPSRAGGAPNSSASSASAIRHRRRAIPDPECGEHLRREQARLERGGRRRPARHGSRSTDAASPCGASTWCRACPARYVRRVVRRHAGILAARALEARRRRHAAPRAHISGPRTWSTSQAAAGHADLRKRSPASPQAVHGAGYARCLQRRGATRERRAGAARGRARHRARSITTSGATRHRVPDATLVALLAAMGVDAADDVRRTAALRAIDAARDEQRIAPLVVLRENARPWTLLCRLPRRWQVRRLRCM